METMWYPKWDPAKEGILLAFEKSRAGERVEIRIKDLDFPLIGYIEKKDMDGEDYLVKLRLDGGGFTKIYRGKIKSWKTLSVPFQSYRNRPIQLDLFKKEIVQLTLFRMSFWSY